MTLNVLDIPSLGIRMYGSSSARFGDDKVVANSFHHQACKDPAPGFKATGWASDGVIEVLEIESPVWKLCVQWHPEHMDNPVMNKLFKAFVDACKNKMVEP